MSSLRKFNFAALIFSLLIYAAEAHAQTPTPLPAPVAPASSPTPASLITKLSVRVLDEKGAPVKGLRAEDFQVQEDGVPQTISSFSADERPVNYVLVVDNTGSLRSQLNQLIEMGRALVASNRPDDEVAVVRFISSDKIEVLQDFTASQTRLNNTLDNLYVEGGLSAIVDAVYLAAKLAAERGRQADGRRTALVLLTDGEERGSFFRLEVALNFLRAEQTQVFTVGFVRELTGKKTIERATGLLNTLAAETGGRAFYPANLTQLYPKSLTWVSETAQQIARELHGQYLISYAPTNQVSNTQYRKLQVILADKPGVGMRTVITRAGYVVVNNAPGSSKRDRETAQVSVVANESHSTSQ